MSKTLLEGVHWVKVLGHWTRYSTVDYFGALDSLANDEIRTRTIIMVPGKLIFKYINVFPI